MARHRREHTPPLAAQGGSPPRRPRLRPLRVSQHPAAVGSPSLRTGTRSYLCLSRCPESRVAAPAPPVTTQSPPLPSAVSRELCLLRTGEGLGAVSTGGPSGPPGTTAVQLSHARSSARAHLCRHTHFGPGCFRRLGHIYTGVGESRFTVVCVGSNAIINT